MGLQWMDQHGSQDEEAATFTLTLRTCTRRKESSVPEEALLRPLSWTQTGAQLGGETYVSPLLGWMNVLPMAADFFGASPHCFLLSL